MPPSSRWGFAAGKVDDGSLVAEPAGALREQKAAVDRVTLSERRPEGRRHHEQRHHTRRRCRITPRMTVPRRTRAQAKSAPSALR